jgi:hypothetical protein
MGIDIIKNIKRGAKDKFKAAAGGLTNFLGSSDQSSGGGGNAGLVFPPDIRAQTDHLPLIEFTAYERNPSPGNLEGKKKPGTGFHQIYLPVQSGLAIGDSAIYNTINLEGKGAKVAQQVSEGGGGITDFLTSIGIGIRDNAKGLEGALTPTSAGDYKKLDARTISNPNTNTSFEGNGIRNFEFGFKLVAKSQPEALTIQQIHETFRYFSYADLNTEKSNLFLSYPCPWTIRFLDMSTGEENPYIPGIWSSYLTAVNSNFNSSANMYFSDNAPLEVDISLTFQETRVLNRNDMLTLKDDPLRGIINGKPSTIAPAAAAGANIENVGGD